MTENQFAMASEWMTNGNIVEFLKENPDANRFELVGFPFKNPFPMLIEVRITDPASGCC